MEPWSGPGASTSRGMEPRSAVKQYGRALQKVTVFFTILQRKRTLTCSREN